MKKNIALVLILTSPVCYSMDTMLINAGGGPGVAVVLQTMLKIIDEDDVEALQRTIASLASSLPKYRLCRSSELPREKPDKRLVLRRSMSYLEALTKKCDETEKS